MMIGNLWYPQFCFGKHVWQPPSWEDIGLTEAFLAGGVVKSALVGSTGSAIFPMKEKGAAWEEITGASREIVWNPAAPGSGSWKSTWSSSSSTSMGGIASPAPRRYRTCLSLLMHQIKHNLVFRFDEGFTRVYHQQLRKACYQSSVWITEETPCIGDWRQLRIFFSFPCHVQASRQSQHISKEPGTWYHHRCQVQASRQIPAYRTCSHVG